MCLLRCVVKLDWWYNMGWFDKKEQPKLGGQAGIAQDALKNRKKQLDDQIDAASGGPSGKDSEAASGTYRLTTDDKRIK